MTLINKLRDVVESDAKLIWTWRNHPQIRQWMFNQNSIDFQEHLTWFLTQLKNPAKIFLIYSHNDVECGFINFTKYDSENAWEWGFYTSPECPKGIGRYMGKTAMQYAFEVMHANKIYGEVLEENYRSIKLHERLGFSHEGFLDRHCLSDGSYQNVLLFGLEKKDYVRN